MSTTSEYWVGPTIGEGSFAQVVYAQHKTTGKRVAIKVVEQVFLKKHPPAMQGLLMERKLLKALSSQQSPHVVNLWASFLDSQCVYLVMELAMGGDLAGLIQLGRSDEKNNDKWHQSIPYYASQLIQAVQFLHSQNIVHCDIKPHNILCTDQGVLQLADFASAIEIEEETIQQNVPRGTSEYSCLELIRAQSSDLTVAVDFWSLGCVFYAMFQGESPFHAASESLSVQSIVDYEKNASIIEMNENVFLKKEWISTIHGLLQVDPSQRIQTWKNIVVMESLALRKMAADRPSDLILPKAQWRQQVDAAELKDGAMGWGIFLL
jgi:serine/threonine protein kinase